MRRPASPRTGPLVEGTRPQHRSDSAPTSRRRVRVAQGVVVAGRVTTFTTRGARTTTRTTSRPSVADAGWPAVDAALLAVDEVEAAVQVDGKVRARVRVPADVDHAVLRDLALATSGVARATSEREVVRVVVRAPRVVNVVTRPATTTR